MAFVLSSWIAIDSATALLGCTRMSGPLNEKRSPLGALWGRSVRHDQLAELDAVPALVRERGVGVAEVEQPCLERLAGAGIHTGIAERLGGDRLHGGERVVHPMMQLLDQQIPLLFGALSIGDVAEYHAHAVSERKQPVRQPAATDDDGLCLGFDRLAPGHRVQEQLSERRLARAGKTSHRLRPTTSRGSRPKWRAASLLKRRMRHSRSTA